MTASKWHPNVFLVGGLILSAALQTGWGRSPWDINNPNQNQSYQDPDKYSRSRTSPNKSLELKEHQEKVQTIRSLIFKEGEIAKEARIKIDPGANTKEGLVFDVLAPLKSFSDSFNLALAKTDFKTNLNQGTKENLLLEVRAILGTDGSIRILRAAAREAPKADASAIPQAVAVQGLSSTPQGTTPPSSHISGAPAVGKGLNSADGLIANQPPASGSLKSLSEQNLPPSAAPNDSGARQNNSLLSPQGNETPIDYHRTLYELGNVFQSPSGDLSQILSDAFGISPDRIQFVQSPQTDASEMPAIVISSPKNEKVTITSVKQVGENRYQISFIGDIKAFPQKIQKMITAAVQKNQQAPAKRSGLPGVYEGTFSVAPPKKIEVLTAIAPTGMASGQNQPGMEPNKLTPAVGPLAVQGARSVEPPYQQPTPLASANDPAINAITPTTSKMLTNLSPESLSRVDHMLLPQDTATQPDANRPSRLGAVVLKNNGQIEFVKLGGRGENEAQRTLMRAPFGLLAPELKKNIQENLAQLGIEEGLSDNTPVEIEFENPQDGHPTITAISLTLEAGTPQLERELVTFRYALSSEGKANESGPAPSPEPSAPQQPPLAPTQPGPQKGPGLVPQPPRAAVRPPRPFLPAQRSLLKDSLKLEPGTYKTEFLDPDNLRRIKITPLAPQEPSLLLLWDFSLENKSFEFLMERNLSDFSDSIRAQIFEKLLEKMNEGGEWAQTCIKNETDLIVTFDVEEDPKTKEMKIIVKAVNPPMKSILLELAQKLGLTLEDVDLMAGSLEGLLSLQNNKTLFLRFGGKEVLALKSERGGLYILATVHSLDKGHPLTLVLSRGTLEKNEKAIDTLAKKTKGEFSAKKILEANPDDDYFTVTITQGDKPSILITPTASPSVAKTRPPKWPNSATP